MSQHVANWIEDFLGTRELERPDGRALYAYRCSREEFESLARALAHSPPHVSRTENMPIRAFVLYAAEWWQRKYDGGAWAWEPILASIGWKQIHYPDLYGPVRNAWRWWKVGLVRLPTSIRYLGTFACQGGLPLALVGDAESSVTRYLRAALKHIAAYRRFVDDPIVLAQDRQHLLRPPTLRRDYVFRLAADLIEAVLDLEDDAQDEDPLNALDQARPDWRQTMPLDLEDARARDLLTGLLREAARNRALPADEFHVDRFLSRTGIGWRIGARVGLPASITAETLARQLNVPATELPPRLQVRTAGENPRVIGLYAAQADDFVLPPKARSLAELWDTQATSEIRLEFLGQGLVGEPVIPTRGSALGELPWAFRGTDDCSFIGKGSVANRSPVILVLVPDGCTPGGGFAVDESFEEHGEEPGLDLDGIGSDTRPDSVADRRRDVNRDRKRTVRYQAIFGDRDGRGIPAVGRAVLRIRLALAVVPRQTHPSLCEGRPSGPCRPSQRSRLAAGKGRVAIAPDRLWTVGRPTRGGR